MRLSVVALPVAASLRPRRRIFISEIVIRAELNSSALQQSGQFRIEEHVAFRFPLRISAEIISERIARAGVHHEFRRSFGECRDEVPKAAGIGFSGEGDTTEMICRPQPRTFPEYARPLRMFSNQCDPCQALRRDFPAGVARILLRNADTLDAVAFEDRGQKLRDDRMDMEMMMPVDVRGHATVVEEPFDLRADFPFQMFRLYRSFVACLARAFFSQKISARIQQRVDVLFGCERRSLRKIDMEPHGDIALFHPSCGIQGVRHIHKERGRAHDASFHALENPVGSWGVYSEVVGVDDEAAHTFILPFWLMLCESIRIVLLASFTLWTIIRLGGWLSSLDD